MLAEIGLRAWEATRDVWMAERDDIEEIRQNARKAYSSFTRDRWTLILVGDLDGVAAGWGARENCDHQISDLWVDPDHQGERVGTALMDAMEAAITEADSPIATLETHARNHRAIAFYKARGYEVKWLSTKYSASLDRDIEKVGMEKMLAAADSQFTPT